MLLLLLQMYVISAAVYGAANLSKCGPIFSVPVALVTSIFDRYLRTISFSVPGISNLVPSGILF